MQLAAEGEGEMNINITLRLVNGNPMWLRVEIRYNAQWGTTCDHHQDINEVKAICRGFAGLCLG